MKKEEFERVINDYDLGHIKTIHKVKRPHYDRPCFILQTTKGKYFLKEYIGGFTPGIVESFNLLKYLQSKNYPNVRFLMTKDKKISSFYQGKPLVIFEFMNLREKHGLSLKEAEELGKYLGRLHILAKKFNMDRKGQNIKSFVNLLNKNSSYVKSAPKNVETAIKEIKRLYLSFKIPSNQPKSVCHVEFTPEHVRFKNEK